MRDAVRFASFVAVITSMAMVLFGEMEHAIYLMAVAIWCHLQAQAGWRVTMTGDPYQDRRTAEQQAALIAEANAGSIV